MRTGLESEVFFWKGLNDHFRVKEIIIGLLEGSVGLTRVRVKEGAVERK